MITESYLSSLAKHQQWFKMAKVYEYFIFEYRIKLNEPTLYK